MTEVWWRLEDFPTATEWSAVWGAATLLVAFGAAWLALRQLRQNADAALEASRPFVIVDFHFRGTIVMFEIRNIGQTAARDVRFTWDPNPVGDRDNTNEVIDRHLVNGGIPFLAPGRTIRYIFADFTKELEPRRFDVKATYMGPANKHQWTSESVLDLDQWAMAVADADHEKDMRREARKQTKAAETQAKTLVQLRRDIGRISEWPDRLSEVVAAQQAVVQRARVESADPSSHGIEK